MTTCGQCKAEWGGMNTAHCAGCHVTYTGITAFDAHRKGSKCNTPGSVGLSLTNRAYPCYGYPADENGAWWATETASTDQGALL